MVRLVEFGKQLNVIIIVLMSLTTVLKTNIIKYFKSSIIK